MTRFSYKIKVSFFVILYCQVVYGQNLTFNLSTLTYNGQFAPYNIFALWITKSDGKYIKTINRQSSTNTYYLTHWRNSSGAKMTDGNTGATLTKHNELYLSDNVLRIPFQWDCKDFTGQAVLYGDYFINVEFSENDNTGKFIQYPFHIGVDNLNISFPNKNVDPDRYFFNAQLNYVASIAGINELKYRNITIYFNKSKKTIQIKTEQKPTDFKKLSIIDFRGKIIYSINNPIITQDFCIGVGAIQSGVYIVDIIVNNNNLHFTNKICI